MNKTMNKIILILSILVIIASGCGHSSNKQANTVSVEGINQSETDDLKSAKTDQTTISVLLENDCNCDKI